MIRQILPVIAVCAVLVQRARAQATPVLLVHGFNADSSTWASTQTLLNSNGYQASAITLNWTLHLASQADAVAARLSGSGVSASTIVVGHSQGGLVSRLASRTTPVAGILTIGSPHAGAPIVNTGPGLQLALGEASLDDELVFEFMPEFCDAHPTDRECQIPDQEVDLALDGLEALQTGAMVWGLVTLDHDDLHDLSPSSDVVGSLEASPGLEQAQNRVAIQVDDEDEASGPFRYLFANSTDADGAASDMEVIGEAIELGGFHIEAAIDENDEDEFDELEMAEGMEDMGLFLADFCPIDWNYNIVGSANNDGVVPFENQVMPNSVTLSLAGVSHAQETGEALTILSALNQITGR